MSPAASTPTLFGPVMRLRIWGPRARFTAPHTRGEPYSEDVATPSAIRRLLLAIYGKPEFEWVVRRIHVIKPIRKMNSVIKGPKGSREVTLQTSTDLVDVEYVVEVQIALNPLRTDDLAKYVGEAHRRLSRGERFQPLYLGIREDEAFYELLDADAVVTPIADSRPLGPILYANLPTDRWHLDEWDSVFFEGMLIDGTLTVPDDLNARHVPTLMAHADRRARGTKEAA